MSIEQGLLNHVARLVVAVREVCEAGGIVHKGELESPDGTVALFGHDDFRAAPQFKIVGLIDLFAEDEHYDVSVLLDGAGFAEIGELRAMVASAALGSATKLRKGDDRYTQFLGNGFQSTGDQIGR